MTHFRLVALVVTLAGASTLLACTTAPPMPMGAAPGSDMAAPQSMAKMEAQMKSMCEMRDRMMNAKTPEERSKLMAEHMEMMQAMMAMMKDRMPQASGKQ